MKNIITKTNKFRKIKFFSKKAEILPTYQNDKFHNLLFPEKLSENNKACGGARYNGLFKNSLKGFPLISIVILPSLFFVFLGAKLFQINLYQTCF